MHTSTTQFVAHPSLLSSSWCGRCDPSAGCEFASHWAGPWWMGVWGAALCWVSGCGSLLDSSLWMTGTSLTWTHVHTRLSKNEKKKTFRCFSATGTAALKYLQTRTAIMWYTLTTSLTWVWGQGCVEWGRGLSLDACHRVLKVQNKRDANAFRYLY